MYVFFVFNLMWFNVKSGGEGASESESDAGGDADNDGESQVFDVDIVLRYWQSILKV